MDALTEKVMETIRQTGSTKRAARALNRQGIKTKKGERFTWPKVRGVIAAHSRLKNGGLAAQTAQVTPADLTEAQDTAWAITAEVTASPRKYFNEVLDSNLSRDTKRTILKGLIDQLI